MTMTREFARTLGLEVEAALKAVAEKHGLDLDLKGGRFDEASFTPRVVFTAKEGAQVQWNRYAALYDLPLDAIGVIVSVKGVAYRILSLSLNKSKFPVNVERIPDGKLFGLQTKAVRSAFPVQQ